MVVMMVHQIDAGVTFRANRTLRFTPTNPSSSIRHLSPLAFSESSAKPVCSSTTWCGQQRLQFYSSQKHSGVSKIPKPQLCIIYVSIHRCIYKYYIIFITTLYIYSIHIYIYTYIIIVKYTCLIPTCARLAFCISLFPRQAIKGWHASCTDLALTPKFGPEKNPGWVGDSCSPFKHTKTILKPIKNHIKTY